MPECALSTIINVDTTAGARLVSAREDGWIATLRNIEGHDSAVSSITFSPDGTKLASGSWDGTVRPWSARTGVPLAILVQSETMPSWPRSIKNRMTYIAFSPDGNQIVSNSPDSTVRLWDLRTCKQLAVLRDDRDSTHPFNENLPVSSSSTTHTTSPEDTAPPRRKTIALSCRCMKRSLCTESPRTAYTAATRISPCITSSNVCLCRNAYVWIHPAKETRKGPGNKSGSSRMAWPVASLPSRSPRRRRARRADAWRP
jgi:hypothetical protein